MKSFQKLEQGTGGLKVQYMMETRFKITRTSLNNGTKNEKIPGKSFLLLA